MQRRMHLSEIVERIDLRDWDVRGLREVRPAWFPNEIERFTLRRVQSLACKGRKRGVHCTNGNDETCCVVQPWLRDRARRMGASVSSLLMRGERRERSTRKGNSRREKRVSRKSWNHGDPPESWSVISIIEQRLKFATFAKFVFSTGDTVQVWSRVFLRFSWLWNRGDLEWSLR